MNNQYLEKAKALRAIEEPHYNCAQSVLIPFCELLSLKEETAYDLARNFGGGMKMGSVCGAVTGGLMALGLSQCDDLDMLDRYYQEFANNHQNCLTCDALLEINEAAGVEKKVHCDQLVYECVARVVKILQEEGKLIDQ